MAIQFSYNFLLKIWSNGFQRLLDNTTTIHLERKGKNMSSNLLCKSSLLFGRPKFKEFLNDVVPKDISHQGISLINDFTENELLFGWSCAFQFLLNES